MKYAAKVDENQPDIVEACRKAGASVAHLHTCGRGIPDLLIGWHDINLLFEVKDGSKEPSKRKLTKEQIKFHNNWKGRIYVIESVEDAVVALERERPKC